MIDFIKLFALDKLKVDDHIINNEVVELKVILIIQQEK